MRAIRPLGGGLADGVRAIENRRRAPRLHEVRSLAELMADLREPGNGLGLVEVDRANLAEVLELLGDRRHHFSCRLVALLDQTMAETAGKAQIIDALWQAGAAEVVESPRRLLGLLQLHNRLADEDGKVFSRPAVGQSLADWAWSKLPWQDA